MNLYDTYTMRNGSVLVAVNGYEGEEDFYLMHNIIKELLTPEDEGYSVDSMCVGGYLRKDGLLIRTSSESPYDCCSFFYNPTKMQPDEVEKVKGWIEAVINELHNRKKPAETAGFFLLYYYVTKYKVYVFWKIMPLLLVYQKISVLSVHPL